MSSIAHWKRQFKSVLRTSAEVQELLSEDRVHGHCRDAGHRWRDTFWSPSITLLTFLLQKGLKVE